MSLLLKAGLTDVVYLLLVIQHGLATNSGGHKLAFRPVESDYNARLQERCGNPDFVAANPTFARSTHVFATQQSTKMEPRLFGGKWVARGRHPWAVAFNSYTFIGGAGAIISKRHILVSRESLQGFKQLENDVRIPVMVGGVCPRTGDGCPNVDMHDVRADMGAFKDNPLSPFQRPILDLGIVQLAEDLDETVLNDTIAVICLPPPDEALPSQLTVYGWGEYEETDIDINSTTGNNAALREAEIPRLSPSDERYAAYAEYCNTSSTQHMSTFCLGDMERKKHTSEQVSDTGGVLAWRNDRSLPPYLFGLPAEMPRNVSNVDKLTVVTSTQEWAYAICYYTGVCVKREWLTRRLTEKPPEAQQFDVFYDPNAWEKPESSTATSVDSTATTTSESTPMTTSEQSTTSWRVVTTTNSPWPEDLLYQTVIVRPKFAYTNASIGLYLDGELPKSYDWREVNVVTPVKNQGGCGSCWAFAAVAVVESQHAIGQLRSGADQIKLTTLSEQEILDCDPVRRGGCAGGWPETALHYVKENGLSSNKHYPYSGCKNEQCRIPSLTEPKVHIRSVNALRDENEAAAWLVKRGPFSVIMHIPNVTFISERRLFMSHLLRLIANSEWLLVCRDIVPMCEANSAESQSGTVRSDHC